MPDAKISQSREANGEISERVATGETALIYKDIKATLQTPFINLIWRRLAVAPGALAGVWRAVKPLYENGVVYQGAQHLSDQMVSDQTKSERRTNMRTVPRVPLEWNDAEIAMETRYTIIALLSAYERANLLNLVTFSAVLERSDTSFSASNGGAFGKAGAPALPSGLEPPTQTIPTQLHYVDLCREDAELVQRFNAIAASAKTERHHASLPLTLIRWPDVMALFIRYLEICDADGGLRHDIERLQTSSVDVGRALGQSISKIDLTDKETRHLRATLVPFMSDTLVRMLVIIRQLKIALD